MYSQSEAVQPWFAVLPPSPPCELAHYLTTAHQMSVAITATAAAAKAAAVADTFRLAAPDDGGGDGGLGGGLGGDGGLGGLGGGAGG